MLPPQLATVPDEAIRQIVAWFDTQPASDDDLTTHIVREPADESPRLNVGNGIEERPVHAETPAVRRRAKASNPPEFGRNRRSIGPHFASVGGRSGRVSR